MPVAVTVGAQLGVAVPSVLVFGRLSLIGVVANLVAVPVAGFVMLYGLPACLVGGVLPVGRSFVMLPVGVGVRVVDTIARLGAARRTPCRCEHRRLAAHRHRGGGGARTAPPNHRVRRRRELRQ